MSEPTDKVLNTVLTADGSLTMRDSVTGELYHNSSGAHLEAVEGYALPSRLEDILQRRKGKASSTVHLLDACFGLGYNTFALWQHILNASHLPIDKIDVTAIELDKSTVKTLPAVLQQECFQELLNALRDQNGNTLVDNLKAFEQLGVPPSSLQFTYQVREGPLFALNLHFDDLRQKVPALAASKAGSFDLVFHDPFSPQKAPYLWTVDLFKHYYNLLREETGRLLTYSAASAVRGGLEEAGFSVYRTRGVGPKKSGGTLASRGKTSALVDDLIFPLHKEEAERLKTSSGIPYRDPDMLSEMKDIQQRRDLEQKEFKQKQAK